MNVDEILTIKYEEDVNKGNITFKEENDGLGVVIDKWDMPIPKPTHNDIMSYETEVLPTFTLNELKNKIKTAINVLLDNTAKSKNYDNCISCATYFNSTNAQWKSEAQTFISWRDIVWAYCLTELEKAKKGDRTIPTLEQFLLEIPSITW